MTTWDISHEKKGIKSMYWTNRTLSHTTHSSEVNNTQKKLPGWKTREEIDVGNTIEYDAKSY